MDIRPSFALRVAAYLYSGLWKGIQDGCYIPQLGVRFRQKAGTVTGKSDLGEVKPVAVFLIPRRIRIVEKGNEPVLSSAAGCVDDMSVRQIDLVTGRCRSIGVDSRRSSSGGSIGSSGRSRFFLLVGPINEK